MRLVRRNLRPVYYSLYLGREEVKDTEGYENGDIMIHYGPVTRLMANVSPASGQAESEMFGVLEGYDKIIVTDRMDCPIDENTVLWIDEEPETEDEHSGLKQLLWVLGMPVTISVPTGKQYAVSPYEYVVKRVARSLHHISYGVAKVKVS